MKLRAADLTESDKQLLFGHVYDEAGHGAAQRLLFQFLDEEQRYELELLGYFHVTGERTGNRYRIHANGAVARESKNDPHRLVMSYCIHPTRPVPAPDVMLAKALMLTTREARFYNTANR